MEMTLYGMSAMNCHAPNLPQVNKQQNKINIANIHILVNIVLKGFLVHDDLQLYSMKSYYSNRTITLCQFEIHVAVY